MAFLTNEPEEKFYNVDEELLRHLQRTFPDTLPKKQVTKYELGRLIGQRSVIDHLIYLMNRKPDR